jgi:hypothetical protein
VSEEHPHPEWFGHDKVALFGAGGMPAAPPAPPGSPARRQGDAALADALSKVGSRQPRPGQFPATAAPKSSVKRAMRRQAETALFTRSQRSLGPRVGAPDPAVEVNPAWRYVIGPVYTRLPWGLKRRIVSATSGVKGWRGGGRRLRRR